MLNGLHANLYENVIIIYTNKKWANWQIWTAKLSAQRVANSLFPENLAFFPDRWALCLDIFALYLEIWAIYLDS